MTEKNITYFISFTAVFLAVLILGFAVSGGNRVSAIENLKKEIENRNVEIQNIESEIAKYQQELSALGRESNTLRNAIATLEASRNKLEADIRLNESRIGEINLNIQVLSKAIEESEMKIENSNQAIAESLRNINESDQLSLLETFLTYDNIADFWSEIEVMERFKDAVSDNLERLDQYKKEAEAKKEESESRREELRGVQVELQEQRQIVEYNKQEKDALLAATRSTESEYQRILQQNIERKEAFERELFEFEAQLQMAIDPTSIPQARSGILQWPLDNVYITQMFGRTVDSERLYVSGTHNGVDFRASTGTRVKSALDGVVRAVENTDNVPGCFSFGRWVLITHNNGLSTLYAHLSSATVSPGDQVSSGQVIGYSGGSPGTPGAGYSTGPHLHFGVYATQGVEPRAFVSNTPCNGAIMPLADRKAYMDPLNYLPAYNN